MSWIRDLIGFVLCVCLAIVLCGLMLIFGGGASEFEGEL